MKCQLTRLTRSLVHGWLLVWQKKKTSPIFLPKACILSYVTVYVPGLPRQIIFRFALETLLTQVNLFINVYFKYIMSYKFQEEKTRRKKRKVDQTLFLNDLSKTLSLLKLISMTLLGHGSIDCAVKQSLSLHVNLRNLKLRFVMEHHNWEMRFNFLSEIAKNLISKSFI